MTNLHTWGPDQTLALKDGRVLGYRTHGPVDGIPLIFLHGAPGSRYVLSEHDPLARFSDLHLVTPERPGYGLSTPQPDRTLKDWAADIDALAEHLRLSRYSVAGISGGAPHALACGYHNADRVANVFLLSSPAPTSLRASAAGMSFGNRLALGLSRFLPVLVRSSIRSYAAAFKKDPERFVTYVTTQMPPPDRVLMQDRDFRKAMAADMQEAYRQGSDAQFFDGQLAMMASSWGFPLDGVPVPVFAWHGAADTLVPVSAARALAEAVPGLKLTVVPGAGHLLTEDRSVVESIRAILRGEPLTEDSPEPKET